MTGFGTYRPPVHGVRRRHGLDRNRHDRPFSDVRYRQHRGLSPAICGPTACLAEVGKRTFLPFAHRETGLRQCPRWLGQVEWLSAEAKTYLLLDLDQGKGDRANTDDQETVQKRQGFGAKDALNGRQIDDAELSGCHGDDLGPDDLRTADRVPSSDTGVRPDRKTGP